MHTRVQLLRGSRLPAAMLCAAVLLLLGHPGSAHAASPGPQLSIAVDNGSTSATSGDRLDYTVTLTNLGTTKVKDLRVNQTVPDGATFVSADAGGDHTKGTIRWSVDLGATRTITMHSTLALGTTTESALRLATVACAQTSTKGPPLVCASDSDLLPAGAAAATVLEPETDGPNAWLDGRTPWYAGGGAALVLVVVGALLLVRRRRREVAAVVLPVSTPDLR